MNPNDPNNTKETDPLRSAPGNDQTWNRSSEKPDTRPAGQADGADDDEDVDDGEETRQAGATNPGSRRESPDDAMRRDRNQPSPEQGGGSQRTQSDRNSDDRTGE